MIWVHVAELPQLSVATHTRWIGAPAQFTSGGVSPPSSKSTRISPSQLSVKVGVPVTDGSYGVLHSTVISGGQTISGGVVSWNSMLWTQVDVLPQSSVAVQVRMIPGRPVQFGG